MSSNNLYNILNTLKNLEPKESPKAAESKPVYESVESQGSIMSGVKSIEQKLSEAYTAEKAKNPYAVGMAQAMKSTGDKPPLKKSTITKAHDIAKKVKETATYAKLPADQLGLDKFAQAKLAAQPNKLQREKNKIAMQRKVAGADAGLPPEVSEGVEFPDNWQRGMTDDMVEKMFYDFAKEFALEKGITDKSAFKEIAALALQVAMSSGDRSEAGAKFKRLFKKYQDQGMFKGEMPSRTGVEFPNNWQRGMTNDQVEEMFYDFAKEFAAEKGITDKTAIGEIAVLAIQVAMSSGDRKEAGFKFKRLFKKYFDQGMFEGDMEEGNEFSGALAQAKAAGAKEFEVDGKKYPVKEGELTKTSTGVRHRGSYGTEYQGDADEEEAAAKAAEKGPKKRGRPAKGMAKPKPAAGEKKGRGRPKKAAEPTYSGAKGLQSFFGSNPPKSKAKGTVHRMDEARIMDGANETLQHVLNRFKHEVKQFEQTGDLDNDLYEALFDYYMDSGEMPYGVAKARTGDPYDWIADRLSADMGINESPAPAAMAPAFKPGDRVMYAGKFATVITCDGDACGIKVDGQTGTMMAPVSALTLPSYDESVDVRDDGSLNELARLAGLSVEEAAKPDYIDLDKDGDKKEPMKKSAQDAKEVDEALDPVGKEDDDVDNDGDTDSSDEYLKARREKIAKNIKEAEQMLDMMRIAGLDTSKAEAALAEAKKYGDTDVEEAPEYANSPDEEVENVDAIVHQGNDLNREKKQYADKPKAGDNPMATKESVDPLAALGDRLKQAYESIKVTTGK